MSPPLRSCAFRYLLKPLEEAEATLASTAELCFLVMAEVLLEEALVEKVSFICCYPVQWHWAGDSSRKDQPSQTRVAWHSGLVLRINWPRTCINQTLHSTSAGSMILKTDGLGGFLVKTGGEPHACDPFPHRDQLKELTRCSLAQTQPRR